MFDLLNIIISLCIVLLRTHEWRREMNRQGDEYIRHYNYLQRASRKKTQRNLYKRAVKEFKTRKTELNQLETVSKFTAISLVILILTYTGIYYLSSMVSVWQSYAVAIFFYIVSSWLIKFIAEKLGVLDASENPDDVIFVLSCILSIALLFRRWDIGIAVIFSTLGRYIWADYCLKKEKKIISEIKTAFLNEQMAVTVAIEMTVNYLVFYAFYRFIATENTLYTLLVMIAVYVGVISVTVSLGNGLIYTTRATRDAVDKEIMRISDKNKK